MDFLMVQMRCILACSEFGADFLKLLADGGAVIRVVSHFGLRRGERFCLPPRRRRVLRMITLLLWFCKQRIHEHLYGSLIILRLQWFCRVRRRALLHGALNFTANRRHIHSREVVTLKNTVDLSRLLGFHHNLGNAVIGILILEHAIQDSVFLGLPTELLQILIAYSEHLQLRTAAKQIGNGGFPSGALLVFQECIEQNRNLLCALAGDPRGDLRTFQSNFYDLLCGVV